MPSSTRRPGCLRSIGLLLLGLVVVVVLGLLFVPPVQTVGRTLLLVPELIELPVRPLSAFTPQPQVTTTTYGTPADRIDIYVPGGVATDARLPAVVLALGVHPQPIDHPDVARIASAISRLGVVVGVPDSTALRNTQVTPQEPAHLADAALLLAARRDVDPDRVGLAGFSAGASIGIIAAADPRIAPSLRFVSAFGAYADARLLLVDVATRTMLLDGEIEEWSPDPGIRRDVLQLFLSVIDPPDQRARLHSLLEPVVSADAAPTGPDAAVAATLTGDARQAYLLFTARDRQSARAALDATSEAVGQQLDGITPLNFAAAVRARVFLMHGRPDKAIPVSHAALLSQSLGPTIARFTQFGRFEHAQPGADGLGLEDVPDIWALTLHLHAIVAAATE
jgi:dienelactone hydrolase